MQGHVSHNMTDEIVRFIIDVGLSLRTVEKKSVKDLSKVSQPRYDPPSRETVLESIIENYERIRFNVMNVINNESSMKFSLTTDACSSRVFRSYFIITAHWIDGNGERIQFLSHFPGYYPRMVVNRSVQLSRNVLMSGKYKIILLQ